MTKKMAAGKKLDGVVTADEVIALYRERVGFWRALTEAGEIIVNDLAPGEYELTLVDSGYIINSRSVDDINDDAYSPDAFSMRFSDMNEEAEAEMAEWSRILKGER